MSCAAKILVFVTTLLVIYKPTAAQSPEFGGCFSAPGCNAGDEVAVSNSSAEDCCANTVNGLFYSDGGVCTECIAFGWTVRTLEEPESALAYSVVAGYFKGTGTRTLSANIEFVSDSSASLQASAADFESALFASSNRVVMRPASNATVSITLSVDNVAQEGTETGILRLVLIQTLPAGTFFRRDLGVVIEDTSSASVGFNAIEYANNEEELSLAVTVRKISAIANPVSVRVQPLTVEQALALNLDIPRIQDIDITAINPRIPIRARIGVDSAGSNVTDFSNNFIDIAFPADELLTDRTEQITVNIPLVDDDIDEADREYFVLYLTLLDATSSDGLLDVVVSVGGIDDNDDTVIGFEMMDYSFNEPAVGQVDAGETIFLAKQGVTELTYTVLIQRTESTDGLEIDLDYTIGVDGEFGNQIPFPANVQRLRLFPDQLDFTIIADRLAEGPETFGLSSAPEGNPTYLRPRTGDTVFPTATITVIDDDNITVGWEQTTYTVSEGVGVVEACYRIFFPPPTESLRDLMLFMLVDTQPGTADESDYVPLRSDFFDMERELSDGTRRACIEVTIEMDNIYENSEEFCVDLLFSEPNDRFFVNPSVTCITIEDNNTATIGFIGAPYRAREDMGPMLFTVGVIGDTVLDRDVVVSFSTVDGSTPGVMAVAGSDYVMRSGVLLTFNATTRTIQVPVDLIDDLVFENDEDFNGTLTLVSGERVTVAPDNALATIIENEVVCQELELLVNGRIEYFPNTTAPYLAGTEATHICNPGFVLEGNIIRVCQNDTFFDGSPPTCQPIECFPLPPIANGFITYAPDNIPNYSLGTVATYACNDGFSLDLSGGGSEMRTCRDDSNGDAVGEFDGQAPACVPIECPPLPPIANGFITYAPDNVENYELGTNATYGCNDGFVLDLTVGSMVRTCVDDDGMDAVGEFDREAPTCIPIECEPLPDIPNGMISYADDMIPNYELGTVATYECDDGFFLMGDDERNCTAGDGSSAIGVFDGEEPSCNPVECPPLPPIANGFITYAPDTVPDYELGTVATYACNAGFALDFSNGGNETRTCIDDNDGDAEGIFDRQAPICVPIECLPLPSIANGVIMYSPDNVPNYSLGTVATYSCNAGFSLDLSGGGSEMRTCGDDGNGDAVGEFDGMQPACVPIECPPLPPIVNGFITYAPDNVADYSLGTDATYGCNAGFVLDFSNGGSMVRTCRDDGNGDAVGEFDRQAPTCVPIECPPLPSIANGFITYAPDNVENYELGTVATYACSAGFVLDFSNGGSEMRTCIDDGNGDAEGEFDREAPTCVPIECPPLPDIPNGMISYADDMTPNYELGTVATYECDEGFFLDGDDQRNCTAGDGSSAIGVFSGQQPTCVPIECPPLPTIANGFITYAPDNMANYELGTVATYACNAGFALDFSNGGSEMRTCVDDGDGDAEGEFDREAPTCVPIECPPLPSIANGVITYATDNMPDYELGTVATYACNAGFVLDFSNGGSEMRICIDDGNGDAEGVFDRQAPTCVPIECLPLQPIANGVITYALDNVPDYELGTVATYSCNEGFTLNLEVGSETRECVDDGDGDALGVFNRQAPSCESVDNTVNDTATGDPLFTVPLNVLNKSAIMNVGEDDPINLCFEVHGESGAFFNLVSDTCVSVNARYSQVRAGENINIVDRIYVRASGLSGVCRNIEVSLDQCRASVDGVSVENYMMDGITVRRFRNRVRIVVPNCQDIDLVMWVFCLNTTFWSRASTDENEITFNAEMIRFVIARGLDLDERSHGLIGQFWNIPIQVAPYTGPVREGLSSDGYYVITTNHPNEGMRQFIGWLYPLTWEHRSEYCLYGGQYQGGPLYEILDDSVNNGVIFGDYTDYRVASQYATDFAYSHFDESQCSEPAVTPA